MTPKRTHSPSLTSNTPTKRQKKHHPTDTTNRSPEKDISLSLSEPEDTFLRTISHSGGPPQPVISLPSNDEDANDDDTGPYHAISMTAIQAQSSYGGFVQRPVSNDGKDSCKLDDSTRNLIWNVGPTNAPPSQPPASTDDSQTHSSPSVSLSGSDNMVAPRKSRVVQHDGVTAPPDQQRHTGPFAARWNVTRSPEHTVVSPSLGQQYSSPEHWQETATLSSYRPEPYRPLSRINSQSGDRSIDEYNSEAGLFESPSSVRDIIDFSLPEPYRPLSSQRGLTSMYSYPLLGDSHRPPSWTNSRSSDRNIDGYGDQTTLPESPSLAPSAVPRSPQPIVASAVSPLSPQQRGSSPRSRIVNNTDRFLLTGRNSQGNSDIPGAPLRSNFQARSLLEAIDPPENDRATEHHQPLTRRRPNASTSGGSANQYSRRVTPGLPPPALGGVLESRKHNDTSPESPSLHQEPTHVHSLISPPLGPLPGATTSSRSPAWPASIRTTRVTLPDGPQEVPGIEDESDDNPCAFRPEPHRPLSRTYSQLGDEDLDEYNGEATLSESPSPAPSTVRRHPKPIDALAESPFPLQQREPSRQPHVTRRH